MYLYAYQVTPRVFFWMNDSKIEHQCHWKLRLLFVCFSGRAAVRIGARRLQKIKAGIHDLHAPWNGQPRRTAKCSIPACDSGEIPLNTLKCSAPASYGSKNPLSTPRCSIPALTSVKPLLTLPAVVFLPMTPVKPLLTLPSVAFLTVTAVKPILALPSVVFLPPVTLQHAVPLRVTAVKPLLTPPPRTVPGKPISELPKCSFPTPHNTPTCSALSSGTPLNTPTCSVPVKPVLALPKRHFSTPHNTPACSAPVRDCNETPPLSTPTCSVPAHDCSETHLNNPLPESPKKKMGPKKLQGLERWLVCLCGGSFCDVISSSYVEGRWEFHQRSHSALLFTLH